MDRKAFPNREEIQKILKKVDDKKKITQLAWRCSVRLLPLLGKNGDFNFWSQRNRKNHIYSVLRALDVSFGFTMLGKRANFEDANFAFAAANDNSDASLPTLQEQYNVAASAAITVSTTTRLENIEDNVATLVIYAVHSLSLINNEIIDLIAEDIHAIKENQEFSSMGGIAVYGAIWDRFKIALENEDCSYWAELYEEIFERGVKEDELNERLKIPEEFRNKGANEVATYIKALLEGSEIFREYRLIIIGDKGAGKTCIARRIVSDSAKMTVPKESTTGINIKAWKKKVKKETYTINIWDFAGHEITHAVHQLFLSERCLYILVLDGRTENDDPNYWLEHIKTFGDNSPTMVLINEKDSNRRNLYIDRKKYPFVIHGESRFNIKNDKSKIRSFRNDILNILSTHLEFQLKFPAKFGKIKLRLQEENESFISITKMQEIINEEKIDANNTKKLLNFLNILGVALSYEDINFDYILNPNWITEHIYEIIKYLNDANRHTITKKEIKEVLCRHKEQCKEKINSKECALGCEKVERETNFFYDIIKKFKLAYSTKEDESKLIFPSLMSSNQVKDLTIYEDGLQARYRFSSLLPINTLPLFIVSTYDYIDDHNVWRKGVVLNYSNFDCTVFIREDTEKKIIEIWINGTQRREMFAVIRNKFYEIFEKISGLDVELEVYYDRDEKGNSLFVEFETLMKYLAKGKKVYIGKTAEEYNIYSILGDYMTKENADNEAKTVNNYYNSNVLNQNGENNSNKGNLNLKVKTTTNNEKKPQKSIISKGFTFIKKIFQILGKLILLLGVGEIWGGK